MGYTLDVAYFNTFVISGRNSATSGAMHEQGSFHFEESRIRGEFNGTNVDYGAKAYAVDLEYGTRIRENALMYSGIFNSKTKVNNTNQFPIGSEITKAVDIAHGSIQKLYAEDSDLIIFQENKVSKSLIDKDAIYTAEGTPIKAQSNVVIGNNVPYLGKYGISKNPESFAVSGGRKYFVDKSRGVVLRLSRDGLTPISMYGMKDWYRDALSSSSLTKIVGIYDEVKDHYVVSLHGANTNTDMVETNASNPANQDNVTTYSTLAFGEGVKGWISFYTYKPSWGVSLKGKYYTFNNLNLYEHYNSNTARNNFYGDSYNDPSYIRLIQNDKPSTIKTFLAVSYEGSDNWSLESAETETVVNSSDVATKDEAYKIPKEGVTIIDNEGLDINVGFKRKEGVYYSALRNKNNNKFKDDAYFSNTGLTGYHINMKLQYWETTEDENAKKAELFSVSNEIVQSS